MQDRYRRLDEILLLRTAGPYIWVNRVVFGLSPNVRLSPDSNLKSGHRRCRRCANSCREHVQQTMAYSITSSATESSAGGTVRPSILAVTVLITNSNFVDCTTGRSTGLTPLRIRPA